MAALFAIFLTPAGCGGGGDINLSEEALSAGPVCSGEEPDLSAFVAIGASMTAGMQNECLIESQNKFGPAALVARQLGADLTLPEFSEPGGPFACYTIRSDGSIGYPESVTARSQRLNPEDQTSNIAVPAARVEDFLFAHPSEPPHDNMILLFFLTPVLDPTWAEEGRDDRGVQADIMEALKPSLIVSTDLAGNDLIINLGYRQEWGYYGPYYLAALDRIQKTGTDFFLANQPDLTSLPAWQGDSESDRVNFRMKIIEANAEIEKAMEQKGGHIVDLYSLTRQWAEGVQVGEYFLTNEVGGGLFSLDGLHPSSVSYGMVANLFIEKMNEVYGCRYPLVDLEQILAEDPLSPQKLSCEKTGPSYDIDGYTCQLND